MLSVLATGTLVSDPKSRQSAAGKAYATCNLRVPAEDSEAMLVSVIAFSADTVAAILALSKGDSCAIAGRGKLNTWERDGTQHTGLSVVAERALSVYRAGKQRKLATEAEQSSA